MLMTGETMCKDQWEGFRCVKYFCESKSLENVKPFNLKILTRHALYETLFKVFTLNLKQIGSLHLPWSPELAKNDTFFLKKFFMETPWLQNFYTWFQS